MPIIKYTTLIYGYIITREATKILVVHRSRIWVLQQAGKLAWRMRDGRTAEVKLADVLKLAESERKSGRPPKKRSLRQEDKE